MGEISSGELRLGGMVEMCTVSSTKPWVPERDELPALEIRPWVIPSGPDPRGK